MGAKFELWFGDGVRFDLLPVTAYTWRRRGEPLRIPTPGKNHRVAVCGAFRWPAGPFRYAHGPKSPNTATFLGLLAELERRVRDTGRRILLVLDNGSAHTSKRSQVELARLNGRVDVVWLPKYSSEQLNDIEGVWQHLKADYFSRMLVADPADFTPAVVALLDRLRRPGALRRFLKPRRPEAGRKEIHGVA